MDAHRPVLRFDPWLVLAAIGFVAAVGGAAYPAFRSDPLSAPGLILIVSVTLVALIGIFAFGRIREPMPTGDQALELLDAMPEPAALAVGDDEPGPPGPVAQPR